MLKTDTVDTTKITTQITASSVINNGDTDVEVVTMNAAIVKVNGKVDGWPQTSQSIRNYTLYMQNKDECKKDMSDFDELVDSVLSGVQESGE